MLPILKTPRKTHLEFLDIINELEKHVSSFYKPQSIYNRK